MSEMIPKVGRVNYDALTIWRSGILADMNSLRMYFPSVNPHYPPNYKNSLSCGNAFIVEVFLTFLDSKPMLFGGITRGGAQFGNDYSPDISNEKAGMIQIDRNILSVEDIQRMHDHAATIEAAAGAAQGSIKKTGLFETPNDLCKELNKRLSREFNSKKKAWELFDPSYRQITDVVPKPEELVLTLDNMKMLIGCL